MVPWPPTASAIVSGTVRHDESGPLAAVKTIGLADSLMAQREAHERGADEALLLNTAGEIVEARTANVFIVLDGRLETPPPGSGCLLGITRERVIAVSHDIGMPAVQPPIRPLGAEGGRGDLPDVLDARDPAARWASTGSPSAPGAVPGP